MTNRAQEFPDHRSSLLADAVAGGLHSLAQPLTAALWSLDIAEVKGGEDPSRTLQGAREALDIAIARLDVLRDIIRPFRSGVRFSTESLRHTLGEAYAAQVEVLEHEGIQVSFSKSSAEGTVDAPIKFLQRMSFLIFDLVREAEPCSVVFDVSESERSVTMMASMSYRKTATPRLADSSIATTLRSYIEVLSGVYSTAADSSSFQLWLPKYSARGPFIS